MDADKFAAYIADNYNYGVETSEGVLNEYITEPDLQLSSTLPVDESLFNRSDVPADGEIPPDMVVIAWERKLGFYNGKWLPNITPLLNHADDYGMRLVARITDFDQGGWTLRGRERPVISAWLFFTESES